MSSFLINGFFGLANGRREFITKAGRSGHDMRVYHVHYTTTIQCLDSTSIPADVRVYSSGTDMILADNTVAFVLAKLFIKQDRSAEMDAICLSQVPGDPESDTYEDSIPDVQIPFVFGIGQVSRLVDSMGGGYKRFQLTVSEYVRDQQNCCSVQ